MKFRSHFNNKLNEINKSKKILTQNEYTELCY